MTPRAGLIASLVVLGLTTPCAAEVAVSFPLEGYYRPGQYMPVRVVVRGEEAAELTLSADGAVPTTLVLDGRSTDAVAPLLVVREPLGPLAWTLSGGRTGRLDARLTRVKEHERLVGASGAGADAAAPLFRDKTMIPIALDVTDPTPGPVIAWEVLDALVLPRDAGPMSLLSAGGTAVIVRAEAEPERRWLPWRRVGDAWVMAHEPAGPRDAIVPEAYEPSYGWRPGRPWALRRNVVLVAIVFAILAVALTLWRSRRAVVAIVILSASATGMAFYRAARESPVAVAAGAVLVRRGEAFQADEWEYARALARAEAEVPADSAKKPVFASAGHFERSGLRLVCDEGGRPQWFRFPLAPGGTMAFLTRQPLLRRETEPPPDRSSTGSPLWPLVRQAYLPAGARTEGEVPPPARLGGPDGREHWRGIIVEESSP